jgi:hypothetical protein
VNISLRKARERGRQASHVFLDGELDFDALGVGFCPDEASVYEPDLIEEHSEAL